jgi:hypothetical protein
VYDTFADPEASKALAEKLDSLKRYHLVILVSCDAWELNFSPELA